jgi:hypothetical protein
MTDEPIFRIFNALFVELQCVLNDKLYADFTHNEGVQVYYVKKWHLFFSIR